MKEWKMCENPYSGMSVAAQGKALGRCVFARVSLALLCVAGGMSAWGWGNGHTIISSRAVQLLGHEDRSLFGCELGAYTNHFSLIPDWVYKNDGTEHYVWDFCGGKTPYDSKAFVAFHILPDAADAYYHLLYAVTNAVNAAKVGRTHDFSCYAGVLSHMLEDWTCPAHSTADDNMMTILSTYLPPPEGMEHVAAKMHGKVESGDFNLGDFNYTPRCIAASAEELSFRLVLLAQNASMSARKDIIPMVRAIYASDKREIGRLQRLSGERAAAILADALSTIGSLVRGVGASAEGRDISLLDCRPETCRSLAYPQSQYFGVPYWGHPQVDWCFGGTVKVPLKLNISGRATVVRGYFMGTGKPQTFFIPAGLFKEFKTRVGLHSELGRGSKAAFSVYMNGRKRGEVSAGGDDDAVEMSLPIPSDVTNITLQVSKGSPDNKQYCIWGDPTLCLDILGSDPTSPMAQGVWAQSVKETKDALLDGFRNPPMSARPRTWWHWMHGYVGRDGITADLEAMKEQGLGGFTLFDVGYWPEIHGPVKSLSDEWYDLVLFAGKEAERLGLKMGVHNCPGWTSSGGPWIKPEEAMKDYVCIECKDGVIPKADERTIAILAVPELPPDAVHVPDFALKSFVGNMAFDNGHYKTNVVENVPAASVIPKNRVVDLTAGGAVPTDGKWSILHFKWQAKKTTNHPASDEARGLECDKMSKEGVDAAFRGMLARVVADQRKARVHSIETTLIDSYERGAQSWTQKMPEEFKARRGYDLIPFLPVLSGRYVESGEATERFLRDLRRTNADLFARWYGGYFVEKAHELGLQVEIEPYPGHFDELLQASFADIPMGEFWRGAVGNTGWSALVGAVGRAWRRPIVQTESFTSGMKRTDGWAVTPGMLKQQGDAALAKGVNRFCFHTFAHQPWKGPIASAGIVMGPWGMDFNRANTLWPYFKPWIAYLGRANFLLQQGHGVSDVLYVGGDDPPVRFAPPRIPYGYQLDAVDSFHYRRDAKRGSDGLTVLPSGQKYRCVVRTGDVFDPKGILPDFMVEERIRNDIAWLHRRLDDGTDLYFVANLSGYFRRFAATFRARAAAVELWNAEDGSVAKTEARQRDDGRTDVDIVLGPADSVFVLFRKRPTPGADPAAGVVVQDVEQVVDLSRDWNVEFQPGRGAPASARYDVLQSFSESKDDGIRYFSGEAVYSRCFTVEPGVLAGGKRYLLDLGKVCDVCRVKVNGRDLGIVWRAPWRIDVTSALKGGENSVQVTVANKWSNRMIGDERKGGDFPGTWNVFRDKLYLQRDYPASFASEGRSPDGYYGYATLRTFRKEDELSPAGLIGPVRLVRAGR